MLKRDNCKNCVSGCEHAGKDREDKEKEKLLARLAEIEKLLDEKAVREELSAVDMVTAHKITDTIKDILKGG